MLTRLISQNDVQEVLRAVGRDEFMRRVIEALERELVDLGLGKTAYPPARDGFTRESPAPGVLEWMPYAAQTDTATIKTVAYSPANPDRYALPTILGTLTRYDMVTGRLLAIADGVLLTAIRTGAASAVATRLLSAPDSSVLGLVGAGAQAVTQLHALSEVLPVRQVLVTDQNPARAESLATRAAFLDLDLDVRLATPAEVMAEADVICTATSAAPGVPPVLPDGAHRPHLHVNAVGSDLVGKTELARSTLERAVVVPDHPAQAALEGECQQLVGTAAAAIGPSLGELCADPVLAEPLRHHLTVFDSTGFALEDHVALDVLLAVVDELGLGAEVQFEHHPSDVVNPYSTITA